MQYGTIPRGYYGVGAPSSFLGENGTVYGKQLFPSSLNHMTGWSPFSEEYDQRDGFWIHGGSRNPNSSTSSRGCPIVNSADRNQLQTNTMMVVF